MAKKLLALFLLFICGCASIGTFPHITGTQTDLSKNNYKVIKAGARGVDCGFYLLGLIPFKSPSFARAMGDLRNQVEMEGKATAFINMAKDYSSLYLIIFSVPKITVTADVIEFIDEKEQ